MKFNEKLSFLRKKNDLTQEEFAEKLGVSRQSVSKWESGVAMPELERILEIAKMFNVSLDELLLDKEKQATQPNKHFSIRKLLFIIIPIIIIYIDYIIYRLEGVKYSFDNLEGYLAYLKTQFHFRGTDGFLLASLIYICMLICIIRLIMLVWKPLKTYFMYFYMEVKKELKK